MIEVFASGSPNVAKVLFMLSETNLPYRIPPVDIAKGGQYRDSFVALNPNSEVPLYQVLSLDRPTTVEPAPMRRDRGPIRLADLLRDPRAQR